MEPMLTSGPEFDPIGHDAITDPAGRPRDLLPFETALHIFKATFERFPTVEWSGLVRRPGTELRIARAARKVRISLGVGHALDMAFDADLPAQ